MLVVVVSEFKNKKFNLKLAQKYCKYVFDQGHYPYASHLIYPQILNDSDPSQRELGLKASKAFIKVCSEVWVFYKDGVEDSDGMKQEIACADANYKPVKYFIVNSNGNVIKQVNKLDLTEYASSTVHKFDSIASKLKNGANYNDFEDELNFLLGTKLEERDLEAEEIFERKNREK